MIRSAISVLIGTSLVLLGLTFSEDIARSVLNTGVTDVPAAQAATSSSSGVTLSANVQTSLTMTLSTGTIPLGNLTPGTPLAATTSASVTTNNSAGITFQVNRDTAGQTLLHSDATTAFPDATAWNPASSGNAQLTTAVGANLHFKVGFTGTASGLYNSTYWGPNDTDGASNAKYAGFPTTASTIASNSTYESTSQVIVTRYRIDAPGTQKSGTYSGGVTYTAFANP